VQRLAELPAIAPEQDDAHDQEHPERNGEPRRASTRERRDRVPQAETLGEAGGHEQHGHPWVAPGGNAREACTMRPWQ